MAQSHRDAIFVDGYYVEPKASSFREVGATSAALESAAFYIGAFCKDYNDDFMLCKKDNPDPRACLKEGRRVTRCAQDLYVFPRLYHLF
jgi:NADH dehydrogenase (ubiquinone) 1 alpha subcomplex subunit 8